MELLTLLRVPEGVKQPLEVEPGQTVAPGPGAVLLSVVGLGATSGAAAVPWENGCDIMINAPAPAAISAKMMIPTTIFVTTEPRLPFLPGCVAIGETGCGVSVSGDSNAGDDVGVSEDPEAGDGVRVSEDSRTGVN